jgi:transposase-like protein
MQRRKFTREFKLEAVRLVRERRVAVAQAARDLDVHENVLRKWAKRPIPQNVSSFDSDGQNHQATAPESRHISASARYRDYRMSTHDPLIFIQASLAVELAANATGIRLTRREVSSGKVRQSSCG